MRGEGRGGPVPCLTWERAWVRRAAVGGTASGAGCQGQIPAPSLSSCVTTGRRLVWSLPSPVTWYLPRHTIVRVT